MSQTKKSELTTCTERSERALTRGSPPHPVLPKLIANRGTNLLAIALTHCKQRPTTLSNRGEMRVVELTLAPVLPSCHRARIRYNRANSEKEPS